MHPFVSVIIPAFNAGETITGCLRSLTALSWPRDRLELLIIDDGSTDQTTQIASTFPGVTLLRQPNAGPSSARNRGIAAARGELLAFTDADCLVHPDWIEKLARHFHDPCVIAVGGNQECPPDATPFMRDVHAVLSMMGFVGGYTKSAATVIETRHNASCNVLMRSSVVKTVGGFREGMYPGEDVDLDRRLLQTFRDAKMLYDPQAIVYHYRPTSFSRWGRMMFRYGASNAQNVRLHGIFRLTQVAPFFILAAAVLGAVASKTVGLRKAFSTAVICLFLGIILKKNFKNGQTIFLEEEEGEEEEDPPSNSSIDDCLNPGKSFPRSNSCGRKTFNSQTTGRIAVGKAFNLPVRRVALVALMLCEFIRGYFSSLLWCPRPAPCRGESTA
ncbi:MAG: glycosyltransferase [Candidatus Ozemobacteraceae bacterium]